jgi:heat shock protein HslJ
VTWQWVSTTTPVEETLVENPANYTITFNANGSASIRADCNNVAASYTAEDGSMSITLGPSTLAACADDSLDQRFLGGLEAAALYFFQGGDLYMDLMADGGTMRFSAGSAAAPAPAATATAAPAATGPTASAQNILFTLVSYGPEGAEQSPIEGTSITALFSGATVSGSAGCNDYTGTVTPVEDYFTIGSVAVTAKECVEPAGVMEQEQAFLAALQGTAGYQWLQAETGSGPLTGGRLFYNLADGTSGYLNFIAQ